MAVRLEEIADRSIHAAAAQMSARLACIDAERGGQPPAYAALDLGTNNCRLLIARPAYQQGERSFRILDAFSRIVRLGEGVSRTGALNDAAVERTLAALEICRDKILARSVLRARLIATEACRAATNGAWFIEMVRCHTGLSLEVVDRRTEAHLAAEGCGAMADPRAEAAVIFDIGGGSTEVVWLGRGAGGLGRRVKLWASLKVGVVSLCEQFGGVDVDHAVFEAMVAHVTRLLRPFARRAMRERRCPAFHLLGTSGTVTTLAGLHLDLARYDRRQVDGLWMTQLEVDRAMARLCAMSYRERAAHGCIGADRADLVLAGCAIFEAIRRAFPSPRIRIADRGLREGLLMQMMGADGAWGQL